MTTANKLSLASHIAKLRTQEKAKPIKAYDAILFWGTAADKSYLPHLKGCVGSATTFLRLEKVTTVTQVRMYCENKGITRVISTSTELLAKLLKWDKRKAPSLANYAGSYFTIPDTDIEVVFIQPLQQLVTVKHGKFMATRIISKLTKPDVWLTVPEFSWEVLEPKNEENYFASLTDAFLVSIDIETFKENATIRCISYTGFFWDSSTHSGLRAETVVLPLDSQWALAVMRKWNWELKAGKVLQNGKYDHAYLARYNAPCYNYLWDTATMFHAWYSELPKDLGFLNSFFIREAMYWKDLAETNDLYEYYRYNALDTWGTGCCLLAMLSEIPKWAERNYILEFPLLFPCHMAEMRGIERDMSALEKAAKEQETIIAEKSASLDKILGVANFNVKSSPQMKALLKILGCSDLKSADEKNLIKARFRHPFNARIVGLILDIRAARTLKEKYLQLGAKAKEFHRLDGTGNRILYALNPHGTDSSRLASKEHHFWCGLQIQNIPRGPIVKQTLVADEGFYLAEVDLEQAESRDTAYISGDEGLIDAVEHSPDFHSKNASAFFGVPFEAIFDIEAAKVLDKALRDLAKRVNHGANYNMGWRVLIETMGEAKIAQARILLGLPSVWSMREVAEHLLGQFHKAYPKIKQYFYTGMVEEVVSTHMLTSKAIHYPPTDDCSGETYDAEYDYQTGAWTRYCFGRPDQNKQDLNSYISHPPQSLNAQTLNKAFLKVFFHIAMNPKYAEHFKLLAQIHDSILFQYRIGHEYLCSMVKDYMEVPVKIKAYDGAIRTFTVPAGVKAGKDGEPAKYWSETE